MTALWAMVKSQGRKPERLGSNPRIARSAFRKVMLVASSAAARVSRRLQ